MRYLQRNRQLYAEKPLSPAQFWKDSGTRAHAHNRLDSRQEAEIELI